MQIGSGTVDGTIGLTYLGQTDNFSWGGQLKSLLRTGISKNDYRLGNQVTMNSWFSVKTLYWLSVSARLKGSVVQGISGANPDLNPNMVITADTNNSGGTFVDTGLGLNTYISKGAFKNFRFGVEVEIPISQKFNGIQLRRKETLTFGLQYSL